MTLGNSFQPERRPTCGGWGCTAEREGGRDAGMQAERRGDEAPIMNGGGGPISGSMRSKPRGEWEFAKSHFLFCFNNKDNIMGGKNLRLILYYCK